MAEPRTGLPVALVTGGSRGIGAAVVRLLAASGMHVIINYHAHADHAKAVLDDVLEAAGSGEIIGADVSDEDAVRAMVRQVKASHGRIDVLVNNAGITADGFAAMMSLKKWSSVLDADLTGTFLCCREVIKVMMAAGQGSIVNVSSIAGSPGSLTPSSSASLAYKLHRGIGSSPRLRADGRAIDPRRDRLISARCPRPTLS